MLEGLKVTILPPGPPIEIPWLTYDQAVERRWPEAATVLVAAFRRRGGIPRPEMQWSVKRWSKRDRCYPWTHFARLPDALPPHEPRESE
ncbi:MAG TPA: hypothetical protein VGN57_17355 [Pirellulaceae bacterium]|jgi:hypothetical protein|nr:hypothetical protein [Pirellulaceae bacterium]